MSELSEIKQQWESFAKKPFPSESVNTQIEGYDLVTLDTFAAGCISAFVSQKGKLDEARIEVLQKCVSDLYVVVAKLEGKSKSYFQELLALSE